MEPSADRQIHACGREDAIPMWPRHSLIGYAVEWPIRKRCQTANAQSAFASSERMGQAQSFGKQLPGLVLRRVSVDSLHHQKSRA